MKDKNICMLKAIYSYHPRKICPGKIGFSTSKKEIFGAMEEAKSSFQSMKEIQKHLLHTYQKITYYPE